MDEFRCQLRSSTNNDSNTRGICQGMRRASKQFCNEISHSKRAYLFSFYTVMRGKI